MGCTKLSWSYAVTHIHKVTGARSSVTSSLKISNLWSRQIALISFVSYQNISQNPGNGEMILLHPSLMCWNTEACNRNNNHGRNASFSPAQKFAVQDSQTQLDTSNTKGKTILLCFCLKEKLRTPTIEPAAHCDNHQAKKRFVRARLPSKGWPPHTSYYLV